MLTSWLIVRFYVVLWSLNLIHPTVQQLIELISRFSKFYINVDTNLSANFGIMKINHIYRIQIELTEPAPLISFMDKKLQTNTSIFRKIIFTKLGLFGSCLLPLDWVEGKFRDKNRQYHYIWMKMIYSLPETRKTPTL